ncbi:unnamed protein product [Porites evermanni]|uniref:Uncharacterized protein n=1 Tax=Porites evermanni TaxID=104178 RepID=A0ABN8M8X5_9CNID|nr:unnamed protein product [Porites evermanni]
MVHYFDVISCGIKQMHAQFSLLFGLHNAMVLLMRIYPQNLGMEIWNGTTDFRSAGRLYNYRGPARVNLSLL